MIGRHCHLGPPGRPVIRRGRNLDNPQARNARRMVQSQTIADPRASVMAQNNRGLDPKRIHQGHNIARHLPLGIGSVLRIIGRCVALAIAAQVRDNHPKMLGQHGRDLCPAHAVLRIAMQTNQIGAATRDLRRKRHLATRNGLSRKSLNLCHALRILPQSQISGCRSYPM